MVCPDDVWNFSRKRGRATGANAGVAASTPRSATLRSSAEMRYGSLGGGRNVMGK
jgi:hypothetical protein